MFIISKGVKKGFLGLITFLFTYLAVNPSLIVNLIPENIAKMTIGGAVAGVIVFIANYLKHRK